MNKFCEITFCQQIGSNKQHNQDALFNGEQVFQYKLKTAETRLETRPRFIIGIADGISIIATVPKKPANQPCTY